MAHSTRETLQRAVSLAGGGINSIFGALLGFTLFPFAVAYRLAMQTLGFAFLFPFLAIGTSLLFGLSAYNVGFNLIGSAIFSLVIFGACVGAAAILAPLVISYAALHTVITAPWRGMKMGWEKGFFPMLSQIFSSGFGCEIRTTAGYGFVLRTLLPAAAFWSETGEELDLRTALERSAALAEQRSRQPLTEGEFLRLDLSAEDLAEIKANRCLPLSEEEIGRLTAEDIELQQYKNLFLRLEKEQKCSISQYRPERCDAVILMKQYEINGQWRAVPNSTQVFDRNYLKNWFVGVGESRGNAVHPITKESIKSPKPHADYKTRYVMHPFYCPHEEAPAEGTLPTSARGQGLSQELNLLTKVLRERLAALPARVDTPAANDEGLLPHHR
jgi:hypothetical protein